MNMSLHEIYRDIYILTDEDAEANILCCMFPSGSIMLLPINDLYSCIVT